MFMLTESGWLGKVLFTTLDTKFWDTDVRTALVGIKGVNGNFVMHRTTISYRLFENMEAI